MDDYHRLMIEKQIPEYTRGILAKWQLIRNWLNEKGVASKFVTDRIVALSDELKRQTSGDCKNALSVFREELSIRADPIKIKSEDPAVLIVVGQMLTGTVAEQQYIQLDQYVKALSEVSAA